MGKIPSKTKQNLVRAHGKKEWTLSELQAAILNELYILEMGSQTEPGSVAPPSASFYTGAKKPPAAAKSKPRCPFCAGPHIPSLCDSFKDSKQRCDIVRQNKLCYNCLGHHKVSACNSRHRCRNCQRKHHTSLCTNEQNGDTSEQPTPPSATQQNVTTTSQNLAVTNQPSATTPTGSTSLSATAPPPQNTVCLLKTAVATIRHGPNHTRANLLFDEGLQRSFITESLASTLALQPHHKEDITISSFGAQRQLNKQTNVAVVHLVTLTGQTIPLTVLVVPHIATPLQNTITFGVADTSRSSPGPPH